MWLYSADGHVSVVVDRSDDRYLWVRARNKKSLAPFLPRYELVRMSGSDYEYRVRVSKDAFIDHLSEYVSAMEYDNFKQHLLSIGTLDAEYRAFNSVYSAGRSFEDVR